MIPVNNHIHVVIGILKRKDKLLVAERPPGRSYSGYWEFPGGKREENESSLDALIRELNEELGIKVSNATWCFEHHHTYPDKNVFMEVWFVDKFSGEPVGLENQKLCWATFDEIIELRILEGNKPILDRIKSDLFS